jgi:hypothetical protein
MGATGVTVTNSTYFTITVYSMCSTTVISKSTIPSIYTYDISTGLAGTIGTIAALAWT